ncbi:MAG: hypothetical protein H6715_05420 [Myxococcales bacterium]|nr:hypothetical protein [Myxococcales bacterium]
MPDDQRPNTQLYAQALQEALDSVVAPEVRDEVIATALQVAGLSEPPGKQTALLAFVRKALRTTLEEVVGRKTALLAIEEVHRLLGIQNDFADGSSEIRRISELSLPPTGTSGSSGPVKRKSNDSDRMLKTRTARQTIPASHDLPPAVFIATTDVTSSQQLAARLDGVASVQAIDDLFSLMEEIHNARDRPLVVIVDGHMPAISITTIAALGPELPEHAHVLLWRSDTSSQQQAHALFDKSRDWLRLPDAHSLDQVAELCDCLLKST